MIAVLGVLFVVVAAALLVLWNHRLKQSMTLHSSDPAKPPILPLDPIGFVVKHFLRMVSGDIAKQPDSFRIHKEVVMGSHKDIEPKVRAAFFFGFRSYTIWDMAMVKQAYTSSSLGKIPGLSQPIEKTIGKSVLLANGDDWTRLRHVRPIHFQTAFEKNLWLNGFTLLVNESCLSCSKH